MCGGAIISEFIPQREARGKRALRADDLWPHPTAGFDDVAAADGYEFTSAASFPHDQGTSSSEQGNPARACSGRSVASSNYY